VAELERRRKAFLDSGNAVHASALEEVEQEREVAVEAETVRERQKPASFHPHNFSTLAKELRDFVATGNLEPAHRIWETAFSYMKRCATASKYPAELPSCPKLLVSAAFREAVIVPSGKANDDFLVSASAALHLDCNANLVRLATSRVATLVDDHQLRGSRQPRRSRGAISAVSRLADAGGASVGLLRPNQPENAAVQ
jgi:hypothetical protein